MALEAAKKLKLLAAVEIARIYSDVRILLPPIVVKRTQSKFELEAKIRIYKLYNTLFAIYINIQEKIHTGYATQNKNPPLMQKTHIHMQPHILHQSYIF